MKKNSPNLRALAEKITQCDALILGAGAGLSAAAGLHYSGDRFMQYFADFHEEYAINDIYSGGFYPFSTEEELWGWWCRHIYYNRYLPPALDLYQKIFALIQDKNYFVLTTNVDHQFQKAMVPQERLFFTQGDYGLFQCEIPCCQQTFSNETVVREMIDQQKGRFIPTELIPTCPFCGGKVTPHLRKDNSFVEDSHWQESQKRYTNFLQSNQDKEVLFLELGVGFNTPTIIKFPFMQMTYQWENATFSSINQEQEPIPKEIRKKSLIYQGDLAEIISQLKR